MSFIPHKNINPRLGAFKDPTDNRDIPMRAVLQPVTLPDVVDYEKHMSPAREQGNRGACVGFATCAVKEFQERKQRKFKGQYDFSEEWIYEQIRIPGGGSYLRDAMKTLQGSGVPKEQYMPYLNTIVDDSQEPAFNPNVGAKRNAAYYKAGGYARLLNANDIMASLSANGPCIIGVSWLQDWFNPTTSEGFYPVLKAGQGASAGGHALCICGYDKTKGLLKFKNSWGGAWGKDGFGYFDISAIEQNLYDAWASFDLASKAIDNQEFMRLYAQRNLA